MIKVRELRIGNWISLTSGPIARVATIYNNGDIKCSYHLGKDDDFLAKDEDLLITDENLIEPLRLTEDILLKNGFTRTFYSSDNISYRKEDFTMHRDGLNDFWVYIGGRYITVNYVHQLQNILSCLNINDFIS